MDKTSIFSSNETDLTGIVLFGTESSGNQKKIWKDGFLIKLNSKYHEDEKEVSACIIGKAFGLNMLQYSKGIYYINNTAYKGCQSKCYLSVGEQSISFASLIARSSFSVPMKMSAKDYFVKLIDTISEITAINANILAEYVLEILVFDFIVCNPDRHLSNLELIYDVNAKVFRLSPIFDNGQAFLYSNTQLTEQQYKDRLRKLKMKPFSSNPKTNLIDIGIAKKIAAKYLDNAGGYQKIADLDMNSYHSWLIRKRLRTLLEDM